MQPSNILSLQEVTKYFYTADSLFNNEKIFSTLDSVSLKIKESSYSGIVGESGSVKTTIERLMCDIY